MVNKISVMCWKSIFHYYSTFNSTCWIYRADTLCSMHDCRIDRLYDRSKLAILVLVIFNACDTIPRKHHQINASHAVISNIYHRNHLNLLMFYKDSSNISCTFSKACHATFVHVQSGFVPSTHFGQWHSYIRKPMDIFKRMFHVFDTKNQLDLFCIISKKFTPAL